MSIHTSSGAEQAQQTQNAMRQAMGDNSTAFWTSQDKALDAMQEYSNCMQDFAKGWFARRHEGANAAMNASRRMLRAQNPSEAISEYRNWLKGALDRTIADAEALQSQISHIAEKAEQRRDGQYQDQRNQYNDQ